MKEFAGFQEQKHTADWELEAWAPDFLSLLVQTALGMDALAGTRLEESSRTARQFTIMGHDPESLLVRFLNELLFLGEQEKLGFDHFDLALDDQVLSVEAQGSRIISQDKVIKAVTYHNLVVRRTNFGLAVNVVFDV